MVKVGGPCLGPGELPGITCGITEIPDSCKWRYGKDEHQGKPCCTKKRCARFLHAIKEKPADPADAAATDATGAQALCSLSTADTNSPQTGRKRLRDISEEGPQSAPPPPPLPEVERRPSSPPPSMPSQVDPTMFNTAIDNDVDQNKDDEDSDDGEISEDSDDGRLKELGHLPNPVDFSAAIREGWNEPGE
mmetsp:Transcript_935/g.1577  ORF Transcript_935/g.1577 Transcript_935/m.1577 type:complete len:191 (+) Transcript_935:122-694(+)|eukprot:CAMPEP_0119327176 /NCGR_PEP_ID=MMETSP1333-20130426/70096_1 /TAXON_ID=418940 /ORGANISM="Scyphosphaera apsteinii, Strain RCC1455" /LENGTH=190 /DNA_ID=CAMNT_0007335683 /DNA_START=89 /DNA_END=661 /DNA_ORIENTATION=+